MIRRLLPRLLGAAAVFTLAALALPALSRPAEEAEKPLGDVPADLKLVPRDALFFVSFRMSEALADPTLKTVMEAMEFGPGRGRSDEMLGNIDPAGIERVTVFLRRADQGPLQIVHTKKPYDAKAVLKALDAGRELTAHGKTFFDSGKRWGPTSVWPADEKTFVVGDMRSLVPYLAVMEKAGKTHPLADELKAAAGKHHFTFAARPALAFRQMAALSAKEARWKDRMKKDAPRFEKGKFDGGKPPPPEKDVPKREFEPVRFQKEVFPKDKFSKGPPPLDPKDMKDEPLELKELEDAVRDAGPRGQWMTILSPMFRCRRVLATADLGDEVKAWAKAEFAGDADAKDGETVAEMALIIARESAGALFRRRDMDMKAEPFAGLVKSAKEALRASEVKRDGKTVEVSAKGKFDTTGLAKWVKEQLPVRQDMNNFRQIVIAFHTYHDSRGNFPPQAICDARGKPLLSWRVAILPYIEQEALYKQFKLDEPWDSPHNKKLLAKMPKIYAPVAGAAVAEPDATVYQVFTGPRTMYPTPDPKRSFVNITDGTSNTILIAEASKAVPWTKPEDLVVTDKALPKLGGQFKGFYHVAMCDGYVRKVGPKVSAETLRAAITPDGGEVLGSDW